VTSRWRLNRAGILNVYQYGDETLHFGGGRLLLRGVNGSGKSTAMNMLLPFLIDADTRRIDAAGEQAAVLRSWMLSGRDEQQPVGYLWIEFACTDEATDEQQFLVCGCGIKANRSTDRVSTWWFVTDRRPGVDLALMEGRVPLSVDVLRSELGPHAVFSHDQRSAYRQAVRDALFRGRDLDQHIRLLHIVRNPRVGDRIDAELPAYLREALPQLSEAAIDDAAQPLEDLEEHRRNVHSLAQTSRTLQGLIQIYSAYANDELRQRASSLIVLSEDVARRRQKADRLRRRAVEAREHLDLADRRVRSISADIERLRQEIAALQASPAYQQGIELDDLREHVATLTLGTEEAREQLSREETRRDRAGGAVRSAAGTATEDHTALRSAIGELTELARSARLAVRIAELPALITNDDDSIPLPVGEIDTDAMKASLSASQAAALQRRGDVDEVLEGLERIDRRQAELVETERALERAEADRAEALENLEHLRHKLSGALDTWREQLREWLEQLSAVTTERTADFDDSSLDAPELVEQRSEVLAALFRTASDLIDAAQASLLAVESRRDVEQEEVDRLAAELADLRARTYPDPPAAPWQRQDRHACLADLIDFADHVDERDRIGLEAALEASGLLGAEVDLDGTLRLANGDLVVAAGQQVDAPLSELLAVTVPTRLQPDVDAGTVTKILDSISADLHSSAGTVATVNGEFRIGSLHGRHAKSEAEHIGVTARRAAIERQRATVERALDAATEVLRATDDHLAQRREHIDGLKAHRDRLPSIRDLDIAHERASLAAEAVERASERKAEAEQARRTADDRHADAVTEAARVAATHQLPTDRARLLEVIASLDQTGTLCREASAALALLVRTHRDWHARADDWRTASSAVEQAINRLDDAITKHQERAMRLATLEDAIGTEYQEVLAALEVSRADLTAAETELEVARAAAGAAIETKTNAERDATDAASDVDRAHETCVGAIAPFRRALDVPGLLDAAASSPPADEGAHRSIPPVDDTPEGAQELANAVVAVLAPAERSAVTADGVRQSLRQRREQLGAGWDAEDHQPDDTLPISIGVTGPLGRMPLAAASFHVEAQLAQQSSLLTAKQDQALRNLLQGLVAREVAEKLHAAGELIRLMNERLENVSTAHGIGARLTWKRRGDLDDELSEMIDLLRRPPDLRTVDQDAALTTALSARIDQARRDDPERRYRDLIAEILDYRDWHEIGIVVRRAGRSDERLTRRTPLSEGEKKIVSYLPLFAAVAGSYDALAESEPAAPRFVLLDDAFAKVSEDNHAQLFGLLVEFDLDFIATSERLWGTHATVPDLAITEVLRDAELGVIVLEHSRWNGHAHLERS
jgi:uncharacterized protein (TIGR02680 family)